MAGAAYAALADSSLSDLFRAFLPFLPKKFDLVGTIYGAFCLFSFWQRNIAAVGELSNSAVVWNYGYCLVTSFTRRHSIGTELHGWWSIVDYFATGNPPGREFAVICHQGCLEFPGRRTAAGRRLDKVAQVKGGKGQWTLWTTAAQVGQPKLILEPREAKPKTWETLLVRIPSGKI